MSETGFSAQAFVDDSRRVFTDTRAFFSALPVSGGFTDPLVRAVIYGLAAGVINLFWSLFGVGIMPFGSSGLLALVGMPVMAVFSLFLGGAVIWGVSWLCGGLVAFEAALRVQAVLMVLFPLRAAVNVFYAASPRLGVVLDLALAFYGVWLGYNALLLTLKAEEGKARIAGIAFAVLVLLTALAR